MVSTCYKGLYPMDNAGPRGISSLKDKRRQMEIPLLEHVPSSQDHNPIESCWRCIKKKIKKYPKFPGNSDLLEAAAKREWDCDSDGNYQSSSIACQIGCARRFPMKECQQNINGEKFHYYSNIKLLIHRAYGCCVVVI